MVKWHFGCFYSQFTLTIRADDDTLWCMGLSEHDLNLVPNPVPVFNDYRAVGQATEDLAPDAILPFPASKYMLKKGHNRVSIHSDIDHVHFADMVETEKKENPVLSRSFEVVLFQGQAYLLPLEVKFTHADLHPASRTILDYSVGWQHQLLLVKSE